MIEENILNFTNINEIKFTRIYGNTYAITINSDIIKDGKELKNIISNIPICNINYELPLTLSRNYEDFYLSKYKKIRDESYNMTIDINLLSQNNNEKIYFTKSK